jgi:hypothetical protein
MFGARPCFLLRSKAPNLHWQTGYFLELREAHSVPAKPPEANSDRIERRIFSIRHQRVILSTDLAALYGVQPRALVQAVKRNTVRFPEDFMFQLTREEFKNLKSQSVISSWGGVRRATPYAFTEHGAIMAATVLNSPQAVRLSILVVRAFVRLRQALAATQILERRLAEIERTLLGHDVALRDLYQKIRPLLRPPAEHPRREVGFRVKEKKTGYGALKRRRK